MPSWNTPRVSRHAYIPPLGLPSARNCFQSETNAWASSGRKRTDLAVSCPANRTPISTASSLISSPFCLAFQFCQIFYYLPQCSRHQREDGLLVIPRPTTRNRIMREFTQAFFQAWTTQGL